MKKIMDKRQLIKRGNNEKPKTGSIPAVDFSYGSPTMVVFFAPKNWHNFTLDAAVAAENMCLAATSLGVGSCIIARAEETFESLKGKEIQKQCTISDDYEAKLIVLLEYVKGDIKEASKRLDNRVFIIR